jgi:hypothetical protein
MKMKRRILISLLVLIPFLKHDSFISAKEKSWAAKNVVVNVENGLRMRTKDNINSEVITTVPYKSELQLIPGSEGGTGDYFKLNEISANWYLVKYKGKQGWVFGGFLELPEKEYSDMLQLFNKTGPLNALKNSDRDYDIQFYDENSGFYGTLDYSSGSKSFYMDSGGPDDSQLLDMKEENGSVIFYSSHTFCVKRGQSSEGIAPCLETKTKYYKTSIDKARALLIIKGSLMRFELKGDVISKYEKK